MGKANEAMHIYRRSCRSLSLMLSCLTVSFRSVVLDVLTPLSDSRQEPVEKMERRISGVSYMCWMDFHNAMLCCGFLCARLISVYSVSILCLFCPFFFLFSGYHAKAYHAPSILHGLSRLYHHCTATTLVYIPATTP